MQQLEQERQNNVVQELKALQEGGFLFHGSPNPNIEELEPRPAEDDDADLTFNTDTAVFATNQAGSTIVLTTVDRASLPKELRNKTWTMNWFENKSRSHFNAEIPIKWKPYLENNIGYIYVLSSETFTDNLHSQFKSKVPVKPIKRIEVKLFDCLELDGEIQWIED